MFNDLNGLKMGVSWDAAQCNLLETDLRFKSSYYPEDRGSKHLWNVVQLLSTS
jgi:hypothetical protein